MAHDGKGNGVLDVAEDLEIFLTPKTKTNPEEVQVTLTWDGFDASSLPFKLSLETRIHRDEPRNSLIRRWKAHFGNKPDLQEIVARLYGEEEEYTWFNHFGKEACPPWVARQQIVFKLRTWTRENASVHPSETRLLYSMSAPFSFPSPPSIGPSPLEPFRSHPLPFHNTDSGSIVSVSLF
jgi:hypothetical protein